MATLQPRDDDINYAEYFGIHNFGAPIFLTLVYGALLSFFLFRAIRQPTYVYIILTVFCVIRIASFALRAALAHSPSAAHSLGTLTAYEILYNIGIFGLLYSAYTLVLDRERLTGLSLGGPFARIFQSSMVIRLLLTTAIALGITGIDLTEFSNHVATGTALRKASVYLFLAVACLLALQTLFVARNEFKGYTPAITRGFNPHALGSTHGIYFLTLIALLLVMREAFFAATVNKPGVQNNERFWYPFAALTELLAALLFAVPGLVPPRAALRAKTQEEEGAGMPVPMAARV